LQILWENIQKLIQEKVSKQNFETWIKPIRILSVDENQVSLAVPNRFFKDWLVENYHHTIRECLVNIIGYDTNVVFVIAQGEIKVETVPATDVSDHQIPATAIKTTKIQYHHTLNPNYSFERFVIGSSNQFAHAASIAVAEHPAKNYNPFFIYGGVGLGKRIFSMRLDC